MIALFSLSSFNLAPSRHRRLADLLAPVVAVEVLELGAEDGPIVEFRVAVYAEEHLLGTPRMEVVLHHEVQKLPAAFADLVDELREGDATQDQTLAGVARLQLAQTTVGV